MTIQKIKASNFKSFDELEVELRPLNILVGANAAGKSNFLEIFRFLRDCSELGYENAVSLQGGMDYLANLKIGASRPVYLELTRTGSKWRVELEKQAEAPGFTALYRITGPRPYKPEELTQPDFKASFFDLDPKLPKRAVPVTGKADLESDGSNLAVVLGNLLKYEEERARLTLLLRDLLPFVTDVKVDRFTADKSLLFSIKEVYAQGDYLPAPFLSDGTIHLTALLVALYFDKSPIVIIEEPERNIHPHLISKVAAMLADASKQKQVIVTTHNPELVKHARLEDLLLVRRDADGFSRISRPAENEHLKVFLENDLGVEDLYVQDLLGFGG
ncbi:MAG TPA: AAA family ATPase [Thermoanaerobaculia bacterium]